MSGDYWKRMKMRNRWLDTYNNSKEHVYGHWKEKHVVKKPRPLTNREWLDREIAGVREAG